MPGIRDIFTIGGCQRLEGQDTPTECQEQRSERDERSLGEFSLLSSGERERDTHPTAVVQFALRGASNTTIQQPEGTPPTFGDMGEGVPKPMGAQVAQNGGQVPLVTATQQAPPLYSGFSSAIARWGAGTEEEIRQNLKWQADILGDTTKIKQFQEMVGALQDF